MQELISHRESSDEYITYKLLNSGYLAFIAYEINDPKELVLQVNKARSIINGLLR